MKKVMQFLKSGYLIVIGIVIGATILTVGALSIPTNIKNDIQTIGTIYISSDGVSTGTNAMVIIDSVTGAALTVRGSMNVGEKLNSVSGQWSTVAGGVNNNLTGDWSMIVGGYANKITNADYSVVMGRRAETSYDSTFVWSDDNGGAFQSTAVRTFIIRATNGVAIGTGGTLGRNSIRIWDGTSGDVAAERYCDENGTGCKTITQLGAGGSTGYREKLGANIYSTGATNVGIGTTGPDQKLTVAQGNIAVKGATSYASTGDTAWLYMGDNSVRVKATKGYGLSITVPGQTDFFNVVQSGYVGIGTTSPTEVLDISGNVRVRGMDPASSANNVVAKDTNGELRYISFDALMSGNGYWTKNGIDIYNSNTTGRVAVGTSAVTASVNAGIFQVDGSIGLLNGSDRFIRVYQGKGCIAGNDLAVEAAAASNFTCAGTPFSGGNVSIDGGASVAGGTMGNVLLASQRGKVGIGTATPTQTLDLSGNIIINQHDMYFKDTNAGIGYYYTTSRPFAGNTGLDGPAIYGWNGGALGWKAGTSGIALRWLSDGKVGIGTTSPTETLDVSGTFVVKNPGYSYSYPTFVVDAGVGVGRLPDAVASFSVLGSAIIGSDLSTITAGASNGFIAGGVDNDINSASAIYSAIVGGGYNRIGGAGSVVAGGNSNITNDQYSFIGGGASNYISATSLDNNAIVGGQSNAINVSTAGWNIVAGGSQNQISGSNLQQCAIIGGSSNLIKGVSSHSIILGGYSNVISGGSYAIVAGSSAQALHDKTFVWNGGVLSPFSSTNTSQFLINADNGVGINTNSPSAGVDLQISDTMKLTPTDAPSSCATVGEGGIYFDNSLSEPCYCDGTTWKQFDGGGSC